MNSTELMDELFEIQWMEYIQGVEQIGCNRGVYTVVMMAIFVAGMVGNVLTCCVIYCDRSMHTITNYYLFDLAVSDILVLLCMLVEVMFHSEGMTFLRSDVECQLKLFLIGVLWNNGILIMTAVAVERYAAITRPLWARRRRVRRRVPAVVVSVAAVAVLQALPDVFISRRTVVTANETICFLAMSWVSRAINAAAAVFTFILPLAVMTYVHIVIVLIINTRKKNNCEDKIFNSRDNRKKVNKLLIALTLSFLLCWLPVISMRLLIALRQVRVLWALTPYWELWYEVMTASALASSVLNPLLFSLMSSKFRKALKVQWHTKILRRSETSIQTTTTFD